MFDLLYSMSITISYRKVLERLQKACFGIESNNEPTISFVNKTYETNEICIKNNVDVTNVANIENIVKMAEHSQMTNIYVEQYDHYNPKYLFIIKQVNLPSIPVGKQ